MCACVCVFVCVGVYAICRVFVLQGIVTGSVDEQLYFDLTALLESSNVAPQRGSRSTYKRRRYAILKKKKTSLHASSVMAWATADTLPALIALVVPSPEAGLCVGPARALLLLLLLLRVCVSV